MSETPNQPAIPEKPKCAHFWKIDPAKSQLSWGVCKKCGERRQFINHVSEEAMYGKRAQD